MKKFLICLLSMICAMSILTLATACDVIGGTTPTSKCTITFMVDGEIYETCITDDEGKITMPADPDLETNLKFEGWYLDEGTWEIPFTTETTIKENFSVYAKISSSVYTVTFIVDGQTYATATSNENLKVTLPEKPEVAEGYKFDGWYTDNGTWKKSFTANTVLEKDISVYAKISRVKYLVTFIVEGQTYSTVASNDEGLVAIPVDPLVDDYSEFFGWYLDEGTWEVPFDSDTIINSNINVYAKVLEVKFDVTFVVEGSTYREIITNADGTVDIPSLPSYGAGYIFDGWFTDEGIWENPFTETTVVTEDTVVYAKVFKHVLSPVTEGTIETLEIGSKVWSSNDYVFTSLPNVFIGNPYILWSIGGPNTVTTLKSGWVYVITGEVKDNNNNNSQVKKLDSYNFKMLDTQFWNIWDAGSKNNVVFEKYVEEGENFELGRWTVMIMSDTKLDLYDEEPIPYDDELAVLAPTGTDTVSNMQLKSQVFADRTYTFYDMPFWLAGKNYILNNYNNTTHSATVTKSGEVYMFTSKAGAISQTSNLVTAGWTDVTDTIPSDLNIFGDSTQNGAFLNNTYKGFALLKKAVVEGDTITWGKWGIPVFSGEFVPSTNMAKLVSNADTTKASKIENKIRLFSNKLHYAMDIPAGLEGLTYFYDRMDTGSYVKAETAGVAYLIIPSGTNAYKTLETSVVDAGWTKVSTKYVRLAPGLTFINRIYQKTVAVGEEINFGNYSMVVGASFDNEDDYYVMPSLNVPADVIVNPTGSNYETSNQAWLGCPTIEITEGGRAWAGWFTGGEKELGTGNYAIVGYSDTYTNAITTDDGMDSWTKQVAVVHPDTAVQVTKPELWTAPNGDLWLFWIQHTGTGNFDGRMGTWVSVCENPDDANPTWSVGRRLTDGYMRSKPIVINDNGVETWMYTAFDWMESHYTRVYASVDQGETWTLRGKAECIDTSTSLNNLDDPVLAQKNDGTLWLLIRPSDGYVVYESFSTDGGYTWTNARKSNIVGPQSRFTIDVLEDDKVLLVFHDHETERRRLTAFLSLDGGKTWGHKLLIAETLGVTYPDTVVRGDTIYVVYDYSRTNHRQILITTFTLDDIIAGDYVSDVSREPIWVDKHH